MEDEVHLVHAVGGPEVDGDEEEGAVDLAGIGQRGRRWGRWTYSTSTMLSSSRRTIILATAAGASGLRSCAKISGADKADLDAPCRRSRTCVRAAGAARPRASNAWQSQRTPF